MIPPLSPASISLYPSPCYLHIKLHLTSISVMESGASGWGFTTTQHLPPRLCCFSMPTVSRSRQSPAAPLPPPVSWQNASFLHERVTLSSASSVICTFLEALVKRLHVAESMLNAEEREDTIINIWGCVQYVCFNHWPHHEGLWVQQQRCFQLFSQLQSKCLHTTNSPGGPGSSTHAGGRRKQPPAKKKQAVGRPSQARINATLDSDLMYFINTQDLNVCTSCHMGREQCSEMWWNLQRWRIPT